MMETEYLAVYDIADGRRLNRTAAILKDYGVRVQKSVFELRLSDSRLEEMLCRLRGVLDERVDGIKIFPLCEACLQRRYRLGNARFSDTATDWIIV